MSFWRAIPARVCRSDCFGLRWRVVFNTTNTPQAREISAFGDPLETLWKNCIFGLCGVNGFPAACSA